MDALCIKKIFLKFYDAIIKTSEITSNSINVKWEQLVKDRDSLRKMFTDTIGKRINSQEY